MRLTNHSLFALLAVVGCGVNDASDITSGSILRIEPSTATVVVEDGKPAFQPYHVYATDSDGVERDVTKYSAMRLVRPELGTWRSGTETALELSGTEVGPSAIIATYDGATTTGGITVYAHTRVVEDAAALANAPALFDAVDPDFTCFPQISYPEAGTILPSNLDGLDVQWVDFRNDVFEVTFETTYARVQLYTTSMENGISADSWAQLASSHEPIALHVSGIAAGEPSRKCTSTKRSLYVTDKPLAGTLYSWSDGLGIYRHDVATSGEPEPVMFVPPTTTTVSAYAISGGPLSGAGCAVSRDGAQIAMRMNDGEGAIFDFTRTNLKTPMVWRAATFTPMANKLVVEQQGVLYEIDVDGNIIQTLDNTQDTSSLDPQLSLDGTRLAYVASTGFSPTGSGALMIRPFMDDGDTFGDATVLVAGQPGVSIYYPAWSPDGQWLTYTQTTGAGSTEPMTSIWAVKADGSQAPVQLTTRTRDVDMAARWAIGDQSIGGQHFYYLTFDSLQQYGAHAELGRQIWMMAFFPTTKLVRPAFHVPFQSSASNHVSQWTTALVR